MTIGIIKTSLIDNKQGIRFILDNLDTFATSCNFFRSASDHKQLSYLKLFRLQGKRNSKFKNHFRLTNNRKKKGNNEILLNANVENRGYHGKMRE